MPTVTRAEFARMAGVSKPAITQAVRRGSIELTEDGNINTDATTNTLYLDSRALGAGTRGNRGAHGSRGASVSPTGTDSHAQTKQKPAPSRTKAPRSPLPSIDTPDVILADIADDIDLAHPERYINAYGDDLVARDKAAQTLQRIAAIKSTEQKRRKEEGELLERGAVADQIAVFASSLHTNLLQMPRRITPQLVALARTEGDRAVEDKLKDEISAAIEKAKADLVVPE